MLSLDWPTLHTSAIFGYLFGSRELDDDELRALETFECRNVDCSHPNDRGTVLAAVREQWGTEEIFDRFVREELVKVFKSGKRRYHERPGRVALDTLELVFGD